MANISLTDSSSLIADASILDVSAIGKTPQSAMHFLRADVIGMMDQTLDQVQINSLTAGFAFSPPFTVDGGTGTFNAGGGLTGELDLYKPARNGKPCPLLPPDQFGNDVEMGDNYYAALAFQVLAAAACDRDTGGVYPAVQCFRECGGEVVSAVWAG